MLFRLADLMDRHANDMAELNGPELGISKASAAQGIRGFHSGLVRYYAGIADKQFGKVLEYGDGALNYTVREPLGVVACMLAWNTPLGSLTQKLPPAIAAGNTVVVRAADEAPLTALYLGRLIQDAGFPPGVINVVSSFGPKSGAYLVEHPGVDGISSVACAFAYQGQGCSAVARVLVPRAMQAAITERIVAIVKSYEPSLPDDPPKAVPTFGPMFSRKQMETTIRFIEIARSDGELLAGGDRVENTPFEQGYYLQPAVASLENTNSELWKEEVFGPLFTITPYRDEADAIDLANDTQFGLSACVWSENLGTARNIARQLRFGTVWVNMALHWSYHSPWGGFKNSGWGREFGADAAQSFTEPKAIWLRQ
jgi:acyl-CoA reductase-like NAD-dependent aldehyde dehydrogenase